MNNMVNAGIGIQFGHQMMKQINETMQMNQSVNNAQQVNNSVSTEGNNGIPKFCPNCGTKTNGMKFCGECGYKLV